MDDWFGGTRKVDTNGNPLLKGMDTTDDYYRYIRDNLTQGRT